ncbi:hypothetical protein ColLi_01375 [Colletotrichum liriopes]|uniref:Uncharacterized protein n=1 Tax=Colletotrichum liriopes TaxID=708192 RepID=A0AA37LNV4_9PEZI|nr:hypothetical protein ColLi_01375 [Colletotrichum liriopes]
MCQGPSSGLVLCLETAFGIESVVAFFVAGKRWRAAGERQSCGSHSGGIQLEGRKAKESGMGMLRVSTEICGLENTRRGKG